MAGGVKEGLDEVARVLRTGGVLIGYDLTDTKLARATHRLDGSPHRLVSPDELSHRLASAGFGRRHVAVSARRHLMRFKAVKVGDGVWDGGASCT